jgi:F-box-like
MLPATPFQSQLATNYVPSKEETTAIQNLINEVEPQLVSLDAEIEAMKARRAIYASFVADHRGLLSPIRQMPPDILRNIFSHCLPYDAPESVMEASEAPMLLAQICSHWRDLVLKTPTLWSTIFLKIPMPPRTVSSFAHALPREISDLQIDIEAAGTAEELFGSLVQAWCRKVESLASLTKLWLSRAESCPLTIVFRDLDSRRYHGPPTPQANKDFTLEPVNALVSLICARSSQWAQLDVHVAESGPIEAAFLSLDPSQVPQLQSLRVHCLPRQSIVEFVGNGNYQITPPEAVARPTFHAMKAIRLRSLSLTAFTGSLTDIPVVWSNLTELSYIGSHRPFSSTGIAGFTSSAALALLRDCPKLVRCSLHLSEYLYTSDGVAAPSVTPSEATVRLPFLKRFVVSESRQGPPLTLLGSLDLPALTSITLSVSPVHISSDQAMPRLSLHPLLLSSSGHLLQHLEIGSLGFAMSVSELVEALKLAEGVRELTINLSNIDPPGGLRSMLPQPQPLFNANNGQVAGTVTVNGVPAPPPPFYRDGLLNGLAGSSDVCPMLEILRLTLGDPSDVTTKALKNLVAHRVVVGSSHHAGTLRNVWVRFTLGSQMSLDGGPGMKNGNKMPVFPRRWREDELNAGFNEKVIRVERSKTLSPYIGMMPGGGGRDGMERIPFETSWESDSRSYERCY